MTYKFIVTGNVQGVWYRKFVAEYAQKNNFKGYIRNLPDTTVEVIVNIKNDEEFEKFISILKKGSPYSKVKNIEYEIISNKNFSNFEIRH